MPLAGCKLQRMWVLLGPSSVMGWRRSMRARLSAAVREMRSQEPRVYTAALPLPTVFRSSDSSGGCICLDLSPFLSQPGLQAPRHVSCPTGGSSLLVSPLLRQGTSTLPTAQTLLPSELNSFSHKPGMGLQGPRGWRSCFSRTWHQVQSCRAPTGARLTS